MLEKAAAARELVDTGLAGGSAESAGFEGVKVALERGVGLLHLAVELDELRLSTWPVGVEFGVGVGDRLVEQRLIVEDVVELVEDEVFELVGATTSTFEYLGLSGAVSTETRASTTKAFSYDAYGQRVSMSLSGGSTHTYARSPHGDVSLLLAEGGSATASYGYRPYGEIDGGLLAGDSDTVNPRNPYRFNDRRLDTGSGSIDMGARRFSPQVGRFLQQDFIGKCSPTWSSRPIRSLRIAMASPAAIQSLSSK